MHDQLFNADSFRRIFDLENRKGNDLATRFFPELFDFTLAVREGVLKLRAARQNAEGLSEADFVKKLGALKQQLKERKALKSQKIDELMEVVSERIRNQSFKIVLSQHLKNGKPVFMVENTAEAYFTVKQLQHNLHRIYHVKQANRHEIVCRIRDALQSKYPFDLIRTDVTSFYESIDRDRLLRQLDEDQRLGATTKRFIRQLLSAYEQLTSMPTGIPRGVGVSAYLAELYLKPLDASLHQTAGLSIYCRYVDDLLLVVARPPDVKGNQHYVPRIEALLKEVGLSINGKKTAVIDTTDKKGFKFEYLGYRFARPRADDAKYSNLVISPSSKKIKKYRDRIDRSFSRYEKDKHRNPRRAFRNLVARVKFLTGNFRLINSKSTAALGVFYGNSLATRLDSFKWLDRRLKRRLEATKNKMLKGRLKSASFSRGFTERVFHNFSTRELRHIVEAWKHG